MLTAEKKTVNVTRISRNDVCKRSIYRTNHYACAVSLMREDMRKQYP